MTDLAERTFGRDLGHPLDETASGPEIVRQPESVTAALPGARAVFIVEARGDGLTCAWYYRAAEVARWTKSAAGAFYACSSLRTVTIPGSLTHIAGAAFLACGSLEELRYAGTPAQWAAIQIDGNNDALSAARIVYGGQS